HASPHIYPSHTNGRRDRHGPTAVFSFDPVVIVRRGGRPYASGHGARPSCHRESTMDELINQRIERLERECQRQGPEARDWKLAGGLAILVAWVFALGAANQERPAKSVESEQFVLRDRAGKKRAELGVSANGHAMMSLSGGDERPRATLIVANDGTPMLNLQ